MKLMQITKFMFQYWRDIQAMVGKLGKESLKRRIGQFQYDAVTAETTAKAKVFIF
jgi:hypothetical protein